MLPSPRSVWVRQAAVHLLWRDDFIGIADAVDMATAIWQRRPWVLALPPEKVVDEILDGKADDDQTPLALPTLYAPTIGPPKQRHGRCQRTARCR